MSEFAENDAACIYYAGCDEPRNTCGYCDTHCLCGAPRSRVIPPATELPDGDAWVARRRAEGAAEVRARVEALADDWETRLIGAECQGCGSPYYVDTSPFADELRAALIAEGSA